MYNTFYVKDGVLHIVDIDGNEITSGDVSIRYWERLSNVIKPPKEKAEPTQYTFIWNNDTKVFELHEPEVNGEFVYGKDIFFLSRVQSVVGDTTTVHVYPMTRIHVSDDGTLQEYVADGLSFYSDIDTSAWEIENDKQISFILCSDTWGEQDDESGNDVQLCALYYALSEISLLNAETAKLYDMFRTKHAEQLHNIKKKYNVSTNSRLTIKQCQF